MSVAFVLLAASTYAQPSPLMPFAVSTVASGMPGAGTTMAADAYGDVFFLNQPFAQATGSSVSALRASGLYQAVVFGSSTQISQLAYNPSDGNVYAAATSGSQLFFSFGLIYQLTPLLPLVETLPVSVNGFTIDDFGRWYVWGQGALPLGLYRHDPAGPPGNLAYLGAPFGVTDVILQALSGGDVLLANGLQVRRWSAATNTFDPTPVFVAPLPGPNQTRAVNSLTRSALNVSGRGAVIVVNEWSAGCSCGTSMSYYLDPAGVATPFAIESFGSNGDGARAIASGAGEAQWWLSSAAGTLTLHRLSSVPATGRPGSLLTVASPGTASASLYGPAGAPFLLGFAVTPLPSGISLFAPPFGVVDLNPFHPAYVALLDGTGITGPPSPAAALDAMGVFVLVATIPPALSGVSLTLQAAVVSASAPNGAFYLTNLATVTL